MKIDSVLKPKHMVWVSGALLAGLLLIVLTRSGAKASVQAPPPIVEVATVEQRDVPVYGEWIGTLTGQVNADVKAQVTGYLLTRKYKEGPTSGRENSSSRSILDHSRRRLTRQRRSWLRQRRN